MSPIQYNRVLFIDLVGHNSINFNSLTYLILLVML